MADEEEVNIGSVNIDGKPISSLRVVDLRKECDKRSLSKSGTKNQLIERLKTQILLDNLKSQDTHKESAISIEQEDDDDRVQNELIKMYLERQKQIMENLENQRIDGDQRTGSVPDISSFGPGVYIRNGPADSIDGDQRTGSVPDISSFGPGVYIRNGPADSIDGDQRTGSVPDISSFGPGVYIRNGPADSIDGDQRTGSVPDISSFGPGVYIRNGPADSIDGDQRTGSVPDISSFGPGVYIRNGPADSMGAANVPAYMKIKTTDSGALKKQHAKLRQRQAQAHTILNSTTARQREANDWEEATPRKILKVEKEKGTIDEKSLQIYLKALEGEEQLKHIRLMVVGMFGVGKTSLVRRLQGESIEGVESTVAIDVHVKKCVLDEDGTWINQESKGSRFDARLTDVVVKSETRAQLKMDQSLQQAPTSPGPSSQQLEKSKNAFEDLGKTDAGKEYIETVQAATSKKFCAGIKPTISIWDFAGQSVYYSTHHFFLSSRSIYLLVMDISKPLDSKVKEEPEVNPSLSFEGSMKKDCTCLDTFKFWVSSIYKQYEVGKQYQPTIVLVGTHGDKLKGDPKEKERQKDDYFDKAREHFDATSVAKLFYPRTFLVSCSDDADDVFNDLKAKITEIAKKQPHWNSNTPAAKWIPLERSIGYEKRKSKEMMKFSEVAVANEENEYNLNDEPEIRQFLQVQHSLGNAIYFDAKDLDGTIIFDPQWLINIFKKFVTHRPSVPNNLRQYWIDYKKTAKLHKELLDYITKTDEKGEQDNMVNEGSDVVRYMEHLDVIAKPVSEEDVDFHLVPCMLKQLMPVDYENKIKDLVNPEEGKSTYVLCFAFNDGFLPPLVFHRLLATYIKKYKIKRRGEELFVYNGFGAFELTSTKTLCIWYADFIIFARVTLHDKKNDILLTNQCINIRKELSDTITQILQLHQQNQAGSSDSNVAGRTDPFKEHILCEKAFLNIELTVLQSTNKFDCMLGLYEVEKMKPFTDCNCFDSVRKGHVIEREMALRYWFEEPHYLKEISKWFEEPEDGDLMQLSGMVNVAEFCELGRRLNIPDGSIQQIQKSDKHHQLQVQELLQQWYKVDNGHNNLKLKQILFKLKENIEDRP